MREKRKEVGKKEKEQEEDRKKNNSKKTHTHTCTHTQKEIEQSQSLRRNVIVVALMHWRSPFVPQVLAGLPRDTTRYRMSCNPFSCV